MTTPLAQDFFYPKAAVDTLIADVPKHVSLKWSTNLALVPLNGAILDQFPCTALLDKVTITGGSVLPTGSPIYIDVAVNGASIYADDAHRPQLAVGQSQQITPASNAIGGAKTFLPTDIVGVSIIHVGNVIAGTGITIGVHAIPQN